MTGIAPTRCEPEDTEADVENKVVMPILQAANSLEIPILDINGKGYLAPIAIDKAAGRNKGYYPEFSAWRKTLPLLIVEAKAPSVVSEIGYREASLYARHLNHLYKKATLLNTIKYLSLCLRIDFRLDVGRSTRKFNQRRILSERLEYLYGVLASTPLFDKYIAHEIGEVLRLESMHDDVNIFQTARCVELFRGYLVKEYSKMTTAYPDFGGADTGAGYVIGR